MHLDVGDELYHLVRGKVVERTRVAEIDDQIAIDDMRRRIVRRDTCGRFAPETVYDRLAYEYYVLASSLLDRNWYTEKGEELKDLKYVDDISEQEERLMLVALGGIDAAGLPLYFGNSLVVFPGSKIDGIATALVKKGFAEEPSWSCAVGALIYRLSERGKLAISARCLSAPRRLAEKKRRDRVQFRVHGRKK